MRSFCFSLLKTTEICFGSTKMGIFYREKTFHAGTKSGKMTLPPQKNMPVTPLLSNVIALQWRYIFIFQMWFPPRISANHTPWDFDTETLMVILSLWATKREYLNVGQIVSYGSVPWNILNQKYFIIGCNFIL